MNQYIHGRTCVYNINYHIVWCVKYRRKVLTPDLSNRLYELVNAIGNEKGFTVVDCKVGENDHVHCFVSAPPKISITQIVKYLKGISGNALLKEFPEIRQLLWKGHLSIIEQKTPSDESVGDECSFFLVMNVFPFLFFDSLLLNVLF